MKLSHQQKLALNRAYGWLREIIKQRPVERTGCPSCRPLPAKHMTYRGERKEVKSKQSIRNRLLRRIIRRITIYSRSETQHEARDRQTHPKSNYKNTPKQIPSILSTAWEAAASCTGALQEAKLMKELQNLKRNK